jgi:hypothetical protein
MHHSPEMLAVTEFFQLGDRATGTRRELVYSVLVDLTRAPILLHHYMELDATRWKNM